MTNAASLYAEWQLIVLARDDLLRLYTAARSACARNPSPVKRAALLKASRQLDIASAACREAEALYEQLSRTDEARIDDPRQLALV